MKKLLFLLCLLQLNSIAQTEKYISLATITSKTQIKESPDINGVKIFEVKKKAVVKVLEYAGESYWKIDSDGRIGFINEVFLAPNNAEAMNQTVKNIEINKANAYKDQRIKYEKDEKEALVKQYGKTKGELISDHVIWIGMTSPMAQASIGSPKNKNTSVYGSGTQEQWVYDNKYLYFENDILTSWQESK